MDFNWKSVVGTLAPTIATALGGPLAGAAVAALGGALGLGSEVTEQQVAAAFQNLTPDQVLAIKQENNRFQEEMAQKGIDLAALVVDDRKSARDREARIGNSRVPEMLALGALLFFLLNIIGCFVLIFLQIKVSSDGSYLLGACNTGSVALLKNVYDYYFGSNMDSLSKNNMIYNSTPLNQSCSPLGGGAIGGALGAASTVFK
jgi:hypothetical protein